jgi:hypothetical protein
MNDSRRKVKRVGKQPKRVSVGTRKSTTERNPPDSRIDTSDIPPLTEDFFRTAVRNPFYRRVK